MFVLISDWCVLLFINVLDKCWSIFKCVFWLLFGMVIKNINWGRLLFRLFYLILWLFFIIVIIGCFIILDFVCGMVMFMLIVVVDFILCFRIVFFKCDVCFI